MSYLTVATCNLNQWALDFEGNRDRIIESIRIAKERGAVFRTGPELEITAYGCLDHFLEEDTFTHSWEMMLDILQNPCCQDILLDVGMPIRHNGVRYNCRVICLNRKLLLIRPKVWLANDGNYREMRYFTPWDQSRGVEEHLLPQIIVKSTGQKTVPFGDAKLRVGDTAIGFETCEELFTPHSPHIDLALDGVEIFTNSSGSHHELRKLDRRLSLIRDATQKCGGVYLYANQRGCDGDRLYYDGSALIVVNGDVVAQGAQFSLEDVEVVTANVDLADVHSYRAAPSFGMQSCSSRRYPSVDSGMSFYKKNHFDTVKSYPIEVRVHTAEEEIALGPACWLWDYLRRSHAAGYFVPLSGGLDSCATATIVYSMCRLVCEACKNGNKQVIKDAQRLAQKDDPWAPSDPKEFCNIIFHTCYFGTSNSSEATRLRAKELANDINAYHMDTKIDSCILAIIQFFEATTGRVPRYKVFGGSHRENLALQNIQARLRMVLSYLFASLIPWLRNIPGGLLVLGSANVDESLRGYLTKYDCSSADINPIGSISKVDLRKFIAWATTNLDLPVLASFLDATPTAELEPTTGEYTQSDEADMGISYEELSIFGRLRKINKMGPYSAFLHLSHAWGSTLTLPSIAQKVKHFFYYYAVNRHKMTVLTPAYHAEQYSPDDNRYDMRPFLSEPFSWAFKQIDKTVEEHRHNSGDEENNSL